MSDAKKCDRCGEFYMPSTGWFVKEQIRKPGNMEAYYDLCNDCHNQLNLFMSGGEVDGYWASKCEGTD